MQRRFVFLFTPSSLLIKLLVENFRLQLPLKLITSRVIRNHDRVTVPERQKMSAPWRKWEPDGSKESGSLGSGSATCPVARRTPAGSVIVDRVIVILRSNTCTNTNYCELTFLQYYFWFSWTNVLTRLNYYIFFVNGKQSQIYQDACATISQNYTVFNSISIVL